MSFRLTTDAVEDLAHIYAFLVEERSVEVAEKVEQRLFDLFDALAAASFDGPASTLPTGDTVRSWPSPPYRVYYYRSDEELVVVRVYDQRREPM